MKCLTTLGLMAGALVVALGLSSAKADEQPAGKSTVLTNESLKEMLVNLGFEPQEVKSTAGDPMYLVTLKRDNWTLAVYVSISPSKTKIWMSAPVADLPQADKVSATALEKLLALNDNLGPTHFCLKGRRLYLCVSLDNVDVAPKQLRTEIDGVLATVRSTHESWKNLATESPVASK